VESLGRDITATNEPKRVDCGAPDYIITRGQTPLGYIEAKDVGVSLDNAEKSEQLNRYRESLGNLILTDYLEFRWYVRPDRTKANEFPESEHRLTARLARVGPNGKLRLEKGGEQQVTELLNAFLNAQVPTVQSAKELAVRMAALARLIRDTIRRALGEEAETGSLHQQMEAFRQVLLHDLTEEQFADMYAQTICYGLFAARCNARGSEHFTREHAAYDLPKTNPFLRKMFNHIAGPELDERIAWTVDDLAELLHRSNISAILEDFGKSTRREDPVVHFYETFLAAYDPRMREARGVYYTPEPVVSYIVRSVDHILKSNFKLASGLADSSKIRIKSPDGNGKVDIHKVLILDPATGTGTFLYGVINQIFESFKKNLGMWSGYVSEHLLPRLFGFELLMAPYAVAHMKLGLLLEQIGYDFKTEERLRVYLTNTLEEAHEVSKLPLFTQWLAEEANEASRVKQELPIMVILGNPPYSRASYNRGKWIEDLMKDYKTTVREEESQIQGLSNDYIKFIRFAQWRIDRTETGVLGLITGHGYVNGPQARDMRASLLKSFDRLYILNLHGSARRTAKTAGHERDEPVFNIQQGTAIILAIKKQGKGKKIFYADLQGSLKKKFAYLATKDIVTTGWIELNPEPPGYYFVPYSDSALSNDEEYRMLWSVPQIFGTGNPKDDKETRWATGFASQQDEFAISFSDSELEAKIAKLLESGSEEDLRAYYRLCTTDQWSYSRAKLELRDDSWKLKVDDCAYRPFDNRRTVYDRNVVSILRTAVMNQLRDGKNIALVSSRVVNDSDFAHVFASNKPVDKIFLSNKTSTNAYVFPLYLYPEHLKQLSLTAPTQGNHDRLINLASAFIAQLAGALKMGFITEEKGDLVKTFGPEDVFGYIYAVLHSPTYRSRYAEFLKIDFPRLPLTSNAELFRGLCRLGSVLVELHLMERSTSAAITTYPVAGANEVVKVRYTAPGEAASEQGRVWINREQYFEGVPPEVWSFHVGGYQVCQKWLKDRKGRKLTYDDLTHYQRIVSALNETIRMMSEIDTAIDAHGGWPIV
ncbi:MAG: type ISP restriction/modification enzyme, partial [Acidobacteriota bacterium]